MALQTLARPICWPGVQVGNTGNIAVSGWATLTAGQYGGIVIKATEDMTISHVEVWVGTVTGSGTLDVRIETVDATTGYATGTLWATNTNNAGATLTSSTSHTLALTASASITKGDVFALVLAYNSGTSVAIQRMGGLRSFSGLVRNYEINHGPAKAALNVALPFALGSSTTSWYAVSGLTPKGSTETLTLNSSTHDWGGVKFQVPFKCRVAGLAHTVTTSEGDFTAKILEGGSYTEIAASGTNDKDILGASGLMETRFTTPVVLSPGIDYRAVFVPTATNKTVPIYIAPSADYLTATIAGNATYQKTTRANGGGAVTDTAARYPLIDLIIDQLDDGVGGGAHFSVSMSG